eukprot:CAMPEP_0204592516 /NCGR_PEP_ID=MMETSP0661-20131031/50984_1 /ASSEMBLY_ACC=CAM_ASM_000606 /TAXON_ID=109239 /ORGANISM="Alexandrium margalefi, Strain AMGDE01CS-322" /LENGTH=162 /DNA_ID=CAMNT_0051602749 /DNA_START=213 /DNA_END=699 /DNA_ORIENTATION=+
MKGRLGAVAGVLDARCAALRLVAAARHLVAAARLLGGRPLADVLLAVGGAEGNRLVAALVALLEEEVRGGPGGGGGPVLRLRRAEGEHAGRVGAAALVALAQRPREPLAAASAAPPHRDGMAAEGRVPVSTSARNRAIRLQGGIWPGTPGPDASLQSDGAVP